MPERTDPPQELPRNVDESLTELVEATLENFEQDPACRETADSVRDYILHKAKMINQTPARPVQPLKGQRRGSTPGFGGLLPRQIEAAVARIERAITHIQRFNEIPALSETRIILQHKYGDERPIRVEVVREEEAYEVQRDYRIFDFLPDLLEDYVDYVKHHLKKAGKHPFGSRLRSQFKTELLAFVRGSEEGQPLYARVSRFMQAYLAHRNPDITDDEWKEFDQEVLGDFARKNIARATSYELSAFAPMEELFPEDPDEE